MLAVSIMDVDDPGSFDVLPILVYEGAAVGKLPTGIGDSIKPSNGVRLDFVASSKKAGGQ
jgi:hypothetical protein